MNRFEASRQSFQEQVPKRKFPRTGYQAMLPRTGSQEKVPKQGSQEQVPKQGSDKQVSSNVSKNSCPGKVPRTLNNRMLQRLKNCSNNGTERLKKSFASKNDTAPAHG